MEATDAQQAAWDAKDQAFRDRVERLERINAELTQAAAVQTAKAGDAERNAIGRFFTKVGARLSVTKRNKVLYKWNRALQDRIQHLETHNAELTQAATERARLLQKRAALDYQLGMEHQKLLAEFKDLEPAFHPLYERCKSYTMTSVERMYGLHKAVEYLARAGIPGDVVETGTWRGGSCMLAALTLQSCNDVTRSIHLFDTFEGHPRPDPDKDVDLWGNRAVNDYDQHRRENPEVGWGAAPLEDVRAALLSTGYPAERIVFVKGLVEETVPRNVPERIALLRLDTDWYESTRVSLEHLYDRLTPGGVLIIDDYGHYQGQRQAVDAFLAARGETLLLHRLDYGCRIALKPGRPQG